MKVICFWVPQLIIISACLIALDYIGNMSDFILSCVQAELFIRELFWLRQHFKNGPYVDRGNPRQCRIDSAHHTQNSI